MSRPANYMYMYYISWKYLLRPICIPIHVKRRENSWGSVYLKECLSNNYQYLIHPLKLLCIEIPAKGGWQNLQVWQFFEINAWMWTVSFTAISDLNQTHVTVFSEKNITFCIITESVVFKFQENLLSASKDDHNEGHCWPH